MTRGERIKQRRLELNLSAEELGEKIGKTRATIYRYENGEIEDMPITILEPLAKALETTPAYLMGWGDDPFIKAHIQSGSTNSPLFIDYITHKESEELMKLPEDIRAAARGMMNLSESDKSLAINMINSLAKKSKEAQDN